MKSQPIIERKSFQKISSPIKLPHFLQLQLESFEEFLQKNLTPGKRKRIGLHEAFLDSFPIEDPNGKFELQYVSYSIGKPYFTQSECIRRNLTYACPLKVKLRLLEYDVNEETGDKKLKQVQESEVYMGDIPIMTDEGHFIINGAERVVVTQLHRSPGVFFDEELNPAGKKLFSARLIPLHGSWIEIRLDARDSLYVLLAARKRVPLTTILRAMGYESDREIIELFYEISQISLKESKCDKAVGGYCAERVIDQETGEIILDVGQMVSHEDIKRLKEHKIAHISVVIFDNPKTVPVIFNTLRTDQTTNKIEAIREVYSAIRPGDVIKKGEEEQVLKEYLLSPKRFNYGPVGRYKVNQRLGLNVSTKEHGLTKDDFIETAKYLLKLRHGEGFTDDIDHLGVRRCRPVGELLSNQIRIALARMARTVRERMRLQDMENLTPDKLISARSLTALINAFFGTSQLSQFMDQTNPLAELTHKRRLSALGPGGLTRERAGFEVRDVHYTHYGRMCPIETPEGQNIGLITSLATYGRINEFGFIETPYRVVKDRIVSDKIIYITADEEDRHTILQASELLDKKGRIIADTVIARQRGDIVEVPASEITLMDISPVQLVSVSASLIPFLEHDDANRALMGSNMQRQSVPLLFPEPPLVGTGMEFKTAIDSGAVIIAKRSGIVSYVDAKRIEISIVADEQTSDLLLEDKDIYELTKFRRSNQNTCMNCRPLVKLGEKVKAGQPIADGPGTKQAELALGRNLLVAFMPWHGYNFEDAIVLSERLVRDDVFTSIHIEEFETQIRETKAGPEELTKEIPNVSDESLKDLDEVGIVRIGAEVIPGDILVGKVTPKGESELTPEMKLLRAIFGEKAGDVKDASLTVPPGIKGVVIGRVLLSRRGRDPEEREKEKKLLKEIEKKYEKMFIDIRKRRDKKIKELIIGKRAQDIIHSETGKQIIPPGTLITDKNIAKIAANINIISHDSTWTDDANTNIRIQNILKQTEDFLALKEEELRIERTKITKGDELPPGVLQLVKVNVAMKRKVTVGDKIAGRHGNKGVVSAIVPEEDMPYLPDGTPVDIILNPLGVPSRMNIGQVLETHLGWAAKKKGIFCATPVFNGATIEEIKKELEETKLPISGKATIYDGKTGEPFPEDVTVGYIYMMKLVHLAEDKIHARSIGPYSLVTQQPLGGKAQFGGQRFGEMEVWALEAYGASYTLQEMLTVKSDDVVGRSKIYEAIVKGENPSEPGLPASFDVLVRELKALGIDVQLVEEEE